MELIMKFKLTDAKNWRVDRDIEINTLEELLKLIDNIKDSDWSVNQIIISENFANKYVKRLKDDRKYEITIYNSYVE